MLPVSVSLDVFLLFLSALPYQRHEIIVWLQRTHNKRETHSPRRRIVSIRRRHSDLPHILPSVPPFQEFAGGVVDEGCEFGNIGVGKRTRARGKVDHCVGEEGCFVECGAEFEAFDNDKGTVWRGVDVSVVSVE